MVPLRNYEQVVAGIATITLMKVGVLIDFVGFVPIAIVIFLARKRKLESSREILS